MRRALPYVLFGAVTFAVFWKFLLFGHTLHAVALLEQKLGLPVREPRGWFRPERPRAPVVDNILLLANHLRLYNEGLHRGELRLWNPSLCCGLPIYADPMTHPFYPPQVVLHTLLPPEPAYEIFLMLHLFFSGTAMYGLLRGLGRTDLAATAGGLVWMLLGYNSVWFSTGILAGLCVWGPLALLFLHRAFERQNLSQAALAGVAMGLAILGSHPQHALHFFIFAIGWLAVSAWRNAHGARFTVRASTLFLLLSLGVGVAAILTRLDTIANGFRNPAADLALVYADGGALWPHILDAILGKASSFENPTFDYEFTFHAGLAAAALAVVGAVRNFRDRRIAFLALAGLAALVLAFVKPMAYLLSLVPILNLSLPSRWLFILGFPLSILVAYGWDSLRESPGKSPFVIASIAGLATATAALRFRTPAAIDIFVGFFLAAGAAYALRRSARAAAVLAVAAILYELLPPYLMTNGHADPGLLHRMPAAVEAAKAREREPWRGTGTLGSPALAALPREAWSEARVASEFLNDLSDGNNLLALFGVDNISGFEAIMPDSYVKYALAAQGTLAPGGRATLFMRFRSRLVDAMNLRYAFLPPGISTPPRFRRVAGDFGTIQLYENPAALARAWLVGRALPARTEREALERITDPEFDPGTTVVLETPPELPPSLFPVTGSATFTRRDPDDLQLRVSTKSAATLVLSENAYPGWEAEVDGLPTPILRANVAFRAVAVPAGDHLVSFRFRPESARLGAMFSALFLGTGLGFILVRRYRGTPGC